MKKKKIGGSRGQGPLFMKSALPLPPPGRKARHADLYFIAESFHTAARKLADALQRDSGLLNRFDVYIVLHTYRRAVEMYLKDIVLNEGGNFLVKKPDPISVGKTQSVSWLSQFVLQIITGLQWENHFRCDGVEDIAEFKKIIEEVNRIDVLDPLLQSSTFANQDAAVQEVQKFTCRLDALLDLLNQTADSLAAEWDLRAAQVKSELDLDDWPDGDTTIQ